MDRAQAYDERLPLPALAARVRTVWIQQTGPASVRQRNLPTGGAELQCPVGGTPRLVGPLTRVKAEILPPGLTIVGARFWPGAASPLLGVPADELVDQIVPFGDMQAEAQTWRPGWQQLPPPMPRCRCCNSNWCASKTGPRRRTRWWPRRCGG